MHPNPRKIIPVILFVVLAGVAWWYFRSERVQTNTDKISASGTIEATQVTLAPEMGGKVVEILANKGDVVQSGQVLVRFEDALLQAQLGQAQATLAQAQANYDLVAAGLRGADRIQLAVRAICAQRRASNPERRTQRYRDCAHRHGAFPGYHCARYRGASRSEWRG